MSKAKAKDMLLANVRSILKPTGDYREKLNLEVHVMNLSSKNLIAANKVQREKDFLKLFNVAYAEFIEAVENKANASSDMNAAIIKMASPDSRGSILVNRQFLVNKNYDTARAFLTEISQKIPNNLYFGQSYRTREYSEYEAEKDIGTRKNLSEILGKCFIKDTYVASTVKVKSIENNTKVYEWVDGKEVFKYIAYKEVESAEYILKEISQNDVGRQIAVDEEGNPKVYETPDRTKRAAIFDQRILSKLDVGHLFASRTPLKEKFNAFQQSLEKVEFGDYTKKITRLIESAQKQLIKSNGNIKIEYHNIADAEGKQIAVVNVAPQLYGVNADLAKLEAAKLREVIAKIVNIVDKIPGSNTLRQDLVGLTRNKLLDVLGLPTKKLASHQPVQISVDLPTAKLTQNKKEVAKSKTKRASTKPAPIKSRTITGQFFSLTSLQRLLDASLVQRVKDNMGTGSRRDILNLRSGRFAESVKVERLSQSREGMITAFYNYMKNPYATFSQGGRQGSPKTRDPKLLIAKSIREIGATMVANRMRAVLV